MKSNSRIDVALVKTAAFRKRKIGRRNSAEVESRLANKPSSFTTKAPWPLSLGKCIRQCSCLTPRCLRCFPRTLTCDKAFCFRWTRSPVSRSYREVWNWLCSQMFQYWRSEGLRACALKPSNHLAVLDVALQRRKFYLAWRNASLTCLCLGEPIRARESAARGVKQWLSHEPNRLLGNIDIIGLLFNNKT